LWHKSSCDAINTRTFITMDACRQRQLPIPDKTSRYLTYYELTFKHVKTAYLKLFSTLYYIGMALVVLGTIAALSNAPWSFWILAFGVAPMFGIRLYNRIVASPERQRINGILLISSVILVCGVAALHFGQRFWIVCMFTSAILDGYASFRKLT
jgi:uncharacterized membrane protein YecN with MAPEG domain